MDKRIVQYFDLVIKSGVSLQQGQKLLIGCPVELAKYAHVLMERAYMAGAKIVYINWRDEIAGKTTYTYAHNSTFDEAEPWHRAMLDPLSSEGAAFINISASNPELLKDIEPSKIIRKAKAIEESIKEHRERLMSNKARWCVMSIPTEAWAKKVFPNESDSIGKLWTAILDAARVDDNAISNWKEHCNVMLSNAKIMNDYNFDYLHYTNKAGTNLKVWLAKGHIWHGGSEPDVNGIIFSANIPTEEIFTVPDYRKTVGVVKSSKPLVYSGNIIDNFSLTFKDGAVVSVEAEKNQNLLEKLVKTDDGAARLGEVALVPYSSPISLSNVLFYNTLFDENASCHLALGKSYPFCVKGSVGLSKEEHDKMGMNNSQIHEDFMIGTEDMNITGVTNDGKEIPVFINGNFAF